MIRSFQDAATERLFYTGKSRVFSGIAMVARRKLQVLDNTNRLDDLREPAGNRLEALKGSRQGQFSIRVNDRYRICFLWQNNEPHEVEIVDYH
ncbi:MAG: type II toxin-antitoxin system RelE/ParE family toxin [Edaphobacter sp.]